MIFNWEYYKNIHNDLCDSDINNYETAFNHFKKFGKKEKRTYTDICIFFNWKEYIEENIDSLPENSLIFNQYGVTIKTDADYKKTDTIGYLNKQITSLLNNLVVNEADMRAHTLEKAKIVQDSRGSTMSEEQVESVKALETQIIMKQAEIFRLEDVIASYRQLISDIKSGTYILA